MPKQRITKEMVIEAAFELAREEGVDQVLVKNIAKKLGCSVQPIYSYCSNMEELRKELRSRIGVFFQEYISKNIDKDDFFHSIGKSYLLLSKEEPHLYEAYFIRKRADYTAKTLEELYENECTKEVAEWLSDNCSITMEAAKKLHLNMVMYTTGLSMLMISSNFGIQIEELDERLIEANEAFLAQARKQSEEK